MIDFYTLAWFSGIYEEVNKAVVDVIAEVCVLRAWIGMIL